MIRRTKSCDQYPQLTDKWQVHHLFFYFGSAQLDAAAQISYI
jgi:hypothetical protein